MSVNWQHTFDIFELKHTDWPTKFNDKQSKLQAADIYALNLFRKER